MYELASELKSTWPGTEPVADTATVAAQGGLDTE